MILADSSISRVVHSIMYGKLCQRCNTHLLKTTSIHYTTAQTTANFSINTISKEIIIAHQTIRTTTMQQNTSDEEVDEFLRVKVSANCWNHQRQWQWHHSTQAVSIATASWQGCGWRGVSSQVMVNCLPPLLCWRGVDRCSFVGGVRPRQITA